MAAEQFSTTPICGVKKCTTANNGETIIFGLRLGTNPQENYQDVDFSISYDLVDSLVSNLLHISNEADELRSENPIHQGSISGGFVLDLDNLKFGQNLKRPGWVVLQFLVKGKSGTATYRIGADRTRLENLRDAIQWYLDRGEGNDQGTTHAH